MGRDDGGENGHGAGECSTAQLPSATVSTVFGSLADELGGQGDVLLRQVDDLDVRFMAAGVLS